MASNMESVVTAEVKTVTHERVWTIQNVEPIYRDFNLANGKSFVFTTNQSPNTTYTWQIGLEKGTYPGSSEPCAFLFCQLSEINGNAEQCIEATFEFETKQVATGARCNHHTETKLFTVGARVKTMSMMNCWKSAVLDTDGSISLYVKLSHAYDNASQAPQSKEENLKELTIRSTKILQENLNKLLSDVEHCDLKIITSDKVELQGHRLILQMQNPVFESMLRSDLSESKTGVIRVTDICGKTMKIILHYLYTQELSSNWDDADIIVEFVYAAGKYQLTEVLKMIDNMLGDKMSEEYSSLILPLLSLTCKLSLKNAEVRLLQQFAQHAAEMKTGEELLAMVATQTNIGFQTNSASTDVSECEEEDEVKVKLVRQLTEHEQRSIATGLGDNWKKLARKVGFRPDEIESFAESHKNDAAFFMLRKWQDADGTAADIIYQLQGIGMKQLAADVFKVNLKMILC